MLKLEGLQKRGHRGRTVRRFVHEALQVVSNRDRAVTMRLDDAVKRAQLSIEQSRLPLGQLGLVARKRVGPPGCKQLYRKLQEPSQAGGFSFEKERLWPAADSTRNGL